MSWYINAKHLYEPTRNKKAKAHYWARGFPGDVSYCGKHELGSYSDTKVFGWVVSVMLGGHCKNCERALESE
jgi:hypothetical protein